MSAVSRTVVALVALVAEIASAQPLPDPLRQDPRADPRSEPRTGGSDSRIPVTLHPTTPPLDADALPPPPPPLSIEHPIDPATYICGPGDVFELDFWGPQDQRIRLLTDLEGRAFVPRVGFVTVAGKTLAAVRTAMTAKVHAIYPGLS